MLPRQIIKQMLAMLFASFLRDSRISRRDASFIILWLLTLFMSIITPVVGVFSAFHYLLILLIDLGVFLLSNKLFFRWVKKIYRRLTERVIYVNEDPNTAKPLLVKMAFIFICQIIFLVFLVQFKGS
jgi:hypothetical protein